MTSQQKNVLRGLLTLCVLAIIIHAFHDLPEKIREEVNKWNKDWFNDACIGQQELLDAYNQRVAMLNARQASDLTRLSDPERAAAYMCEQSISNTCSQEIVEIEAQSQINILNERAAKETEEAERYFSSDMRYAAFISYALDPYVRDQIMAGKGFSEEENPFIDGICLTDRNSDSTSTLVKPGQKDIHEHICNLVWNLESDVIYFTSYGDTAGSSEIFSYSLATRKIACLSGGNLIDLILDEPHIGWLKILNSCFIGDLPGRHWYYAALSPDGKTEIRLTEPSMNIPED